MKLPIEDLTDVILAIGDTYRDYVRSGRQVELILVAPPGGQISNQYKKRHLVAKEKKEVIRVTEVKIVKKVKLVKEVEIVKEVKIVKQLKIVQKVT